MQPHEGELVWYKSGDRWVQGRVTYVGTMVAYVKPLRPRPKLPKTVDGKTYVVPVKLTKLFRKPRRS